MDWKCFGRIGIVDYGRIAWQKIRRKIVVNHRCSALLLNSFMREWCGNGVMGTYVPVEHSIRWARRDPFTDFQVSEINGKSWFTGLTGLGGVDLYFASAQ